MPAPTQLSPLAIGALMTLGMLGQLALNVVLPSLPAIADELADAPGTERLVLSAFLVGFAGGQLLVGPLSDRFGRRTILLPGLLLYAALGGVAALTASMEWLLAARVVQGLGAAAGFVIARAIARDLFDGAALIRVFGLLTLTMGITPGLAPILGGFVQDSLGWEANMAVTMAGGAIVLVLCFFVLPETATRDETPLSAGSVGAGYLSILKERTFRRFAGSNALALGSLYAFHGGGPELMIEKLGLSATGFGIVAFLHSGAYMVGGIVVTRFAERIEDPPRVMAMGITAMFAAAAAMFALGVTGHAGIVVFAALMTLFGFGLGITLPLGVAGALGPFKRRAGAATAFLGATQMTAGAIASAIVGLFDGIPEIAFPAVMLVMTAWAIFNVRRP